MSYAVPNWWKTVAVWSGCVGRLRGWDASGLAGSASFIWFSSRVMLVGLQSSPIRQPKGCPNFPWVLCPGSHLVEIDLVHLLLAVTLMRMIHQGLPLLRASSPSSHGGRWSPMRWMGSQNTSFIQGWAYSAPSRGDWQLCPCSDSPSCTKGSGSPCWNGMVPLDHVCPSDPLLLGTPMGVPL